jgi:hypothetical protein
MRVKKETFSLKQNIVESFIKIILSNLFLIQKVFFLVKFWCTVFLNDLLAKLSALDFC